MRIKLDWSYDARLTSLPLKRSAAHQHFVQHYTEGEKIIRRTGFFSVPVFRCDIARRSGHEHLRRVRYRPGCGRIVLRNSKIRHLDHIFFRYEYIARLDVAVGDLT